MGENRKLVTGHAFGSPKSKFKKTAETMTVWTRATLLYLDDWIVVPPKPNWLADVGRKWRQRNNVDIFASGCGC